MLVQRAIDYSVYLLVRVLVCVLQALPLTACASLARMMAVLCTDILRVKKSVIHENLGYAFPTLAGAARRKLVLQMWEHLFLMVAEIAHAPRKIHDTNWRKYIMLTGSDALVRALLSDRPVIIVSSHYGNFELSGYLLGLLGFASSTVARPLDNPYLNKFLHDFRAAKGQYILNKNGSAGEIDRLLADGGTLTVLGDQHAGRKGCWVRFFGRPASTHKAIALFALVSEAPLALCYCRRVGKPLRHILGAESIVDPKSLDPALGTVPTLTQWYTTVLEEIIRRAPEQYWWVHRRWKDTRPPRRARELVA